MTMTLHTDRDQYICDDYTTGKEVHELSRAYGISERRVGQILQANGITRRPRSLIAKASLSQVHTRVGLHLYTFRFNKGIGPHDAANDLGWTVIKLRKIEKGTTEVELLDLLDIAAYTETRLMEIIDKTHG